MDIDQPHELFHGRDFPEFDIDTRYAGDADPAAIFIDLTRALQDRFPIIREGDSTRYTVTALVSDRGERKNLSLRLPAESSLIRQAAEDGDVFTDTFFGLFSGSTFEKHLLIDSRTEAFMLQPVKYEGRVVGIVGFSSNVADAFLTFDTDRLAAVLERLGERIVRHQASLIP